MPISQDELLAAARRARPNKINLLTFNQYLALPAGSELITISGERLRKGVTDGAIQGKDTYTGDPEDKLALGVPADEDDTTAWELDQWAKDRLAGTSDPSHAVPTFSNAGSDGMLKSGIPTHLSFKRIDQPGLDG